MTTESDHRNEVTLVGRLAGVPSERPMPSGAVLCSFRLVVRRTRPGHGPPVDTLDCAVWQAPARNRAMAWSAGDLVEVRGALRRRFWRAVGGVVSRCEIEVDCVRRLARSDRVVPLPAAASRQVGGPVQRHEPQRRSGSRDVLRSSS